MKTLSSLLTFMLFQTCDFIYLFFGTQKNLHENSKTGKKNHHKIDWNSSFQVEMYWLSSSPFETLLLHQVCCQRDTAFLNMWNGEGHLKAAVSGILLFFSHKSIIWLQRTWNKSLGFFLSISESDSCCVPLKMISIQVWKDMRGFIFGLNYAFNWER